MQRKFIQPKIRKIRKTYSMKNEIAHRSTAIIYAITVYNNSESFNFSFKHLNLQS